jgi:hypothetical protein
MKSDSRIKVLFLALLFAAAVIPCFADGSAALVLSGTVDKTAIISLSVQSVTNLNLSSTTEQTISVANLKEVSNSSAGFTVTVTSTHLGYLAGSGSNTDSVRYYLLSGSSPVDITTAGTELYSQTGKTTSTGVSQALSIKFTGNDALTADTYSDTLTFSITAK